MLVACRRSCKRLERGEEQRAGGAAPRIPLAEDDERDRHPAAPGDDAEGEGVELGDGEIGAGRAPISAPPITSAWRAHAPDADAGGIGGARVLADGAEIEPPGGAVEEEGGDRHGEEARRR